MNFNDCNHDIFIFDSRTDSPTQVSAQARLHKIDSQTI